MFDQEMTKQHAEYEQISTNMVNYEVNVVLS